MPHKLHSLPLLLPEPGPLLTYLAKVYAIDKEKHRDVMEAVRAALSTPEGAILMELLQKSIELSPIPISDDGRALSARNAQAFIAHDLRRILSNETEQLLTRQADLAGQRRSARR